MAERRMFAKTIIDSDAFLDMPLSAQALYFHLSMRADDEGFVNNPKKIQRVIGATDDDLKILIAKSFIIPFESGIVVIKHWKIHNYIRGDRITPTKYTDEKSLLEVKDNGAYTISEEIREIENLDSKDMRKAAYKISSLPYSFSYKMKRAFDGHICPVCGKEMSSAYRTAVPTVQHNIPISKGGAHELENISVICQSCNVSIRDTETDSLNNAEVIQMWDRIVYAEANDIDWFRNPEILEKINVRQVTDKCQTSDGHMTDKCQHRIGKDRIGKDRVGEDSVEEIITAPIPTTYGDHNLVTLSDAEYQGLLNTYGKEITEDYIQRIDEYMYYNNKQYPSHYKTIIRWIEIDKKDGAYHKPKKSTFNNLEQRQETDYDRQAYDLAKAQREAWKKKKGEQDESRNQDK